MAPKRPARPQVSQAKPKRRQKGATQKPPMQRVMVINAAGKKQMTWRPWSEA